MRLLRLTLHNFKGIRNFTLETQGENITVYGDNASGKTTLMDAFLWLLFNKDSQGKADFAIKTLDAAGEVLRGLDHSVEAVLDLDYRQTTLRKVYSEKWTKKRGSATAEFTGHETNHFADGVPVKKNEYEARIAAIADENTFKLLTSPAYFNEQLPWQKRREVLLSVCGDISDEDVIASDGKLSRLPDILQGRKMDDHRKVVAAARSEINKELVALPVRVDEVTRGLPDVDGICTATIKTQISADKDHLTAKQQELARIESGGEVAEKTKALREIEGELLKIQNEHSACMERHVQAKGDAMYAQQRVIADIKIAIGGYETQLQNIATQMAHLDQQIREKRQEFFAENEINFEFDQANVCPTCGQAIPEEQLEEARNKAEAAFNLNKGQKLEAVRAEGLRLKTQFEELQAGNSKLVAMVNESMQTLPAENVKLVQLQAERDAMHNQSIKDTAYTAKLTEKENLEAQIVRLREGGQEQANAILDEIVLIKDGITVTEKLLADVRQYNAGQKRIDELKAEERRLAAEYERLEGELYLTDEFVRTKVRLLEERINSRFKQARFKLFNQLVNGGIEEVCETLYGGVPYSSGLNNSARINVGIDVINTLSEYYGFSAPIFIDNAEAVTQLIPTQGQVIRLVVSGADKVLRVEQEKEIKTKEDF